MVLHRLMPRLRWADCPILKCPYYACPNYFRKFQRRKFCGDNCRKNHWRSNNLEYYKLLRQEWLARKKLERRAARKYIWVVAGEDHTLGERLSIEEALAQASPDTIKEIIEKLKE